MADEDKKTRETISEALSLDASGRPDDAVKKYVESVRLLLNTCYSVDDGEVSVITMIENCLDRIEELATLKLQLIKPSSPTPVESRKPSTGQSAIARMDTGLANIRRQHELAQIALLARQQTTSPSVLVSDLRRQRERMRQRVAEQRRTTLAEMWLKRGLDSVIMTPLRLDWWARSIKAAIGRDPNGLLIPPIAELVRKGAAGDLPVSPLINDFFRRQQHNIGHYLDSSRQDAHLVEEVHAFTALLAEWFEGQFGEELRGLFVDPRLALDVSIQEGLFTTSLGFGLAEMYRRRHVQRDALLCKKFVELGWEGLAEGLGMEGIEDGSLSSFPICSGDPFEDAVSRISTLTTFGSPYAKLSVLVATCTSLCAVLPGKEGGVGGEELLRRLAVVLVRTGGLGGRVCGETALLVDLVPEGLIMGEAGYVLASLQACLDFLEHL